MPSKSLLYKTGPAVEPTKSITTSWEKNRTTSQETAKTTSWSTSWSQGVYTTSWNTNVTTSRTTTTSKSRTTGRSTSQATSVATSDTTSWGTDQSTSRTTNYNTGSTTSISTDRTTDQSTSWITTVTTSRVTDLDSYVTSRTTSQTTSWDFTALTGNLVDGAVLDGRSDTIDLDPTESLIAIGRDTNLENYATPDYTNRLYILNASNLGVVSGTPSITTNIRKVAFNPGGDKLAIVRDGYIDGGDNVPYLIILDTSTWTELSGPAVGLTPIFDVSWSPNGSQLAVVFSTIDETDDGVVIFNTSDWSVVPHSMQQFRAKLATWTGDGNYFAVTYTSTEPKELRIYSTNDWSEINVVPQPVDGVQLKELAPSPDGQYLAVYIQRSATGGQDDHLHLIKLGPGDFTLEKLYYPTSRTADLWQGVAWSSDNSKLASKFSGSNIIIWNMPTGSVLYASYTNQLDNYQVARFYGLGLKFKTNDALLIAGHSSYLSFDNYPAIKQLNPPYTIEETRTTSPTTSWSTAWNAYPDRTTSWTTTFTTSKNTAWLTSWNSGWNTSWSTSHTTNWNTDWNTAINTEWTSNWSSNWATSWTTNWTSSWTTSWNVTVTTSRTTEDTASRTTSSSTNETTSWSSSWNTSQQTSV